MNDIDPFALLDALVSGDIDSDVLMQRDGAPVYSWHSGDQRRMLTVSLEGEIELLTTDRDGTSETLIAYDDGAQRIIRRASDGEIVVGARRADPKPPDR